MKLQTNKAGYFTINAHNLELMLETFPDISRRLYVAKFNGTGNNSVVFGRWISQQAVEELAEELQAAGWLMPGAKNRTYNALQNAVFELYERGDLPCCECDYFDSEPLMARGDEDVTWSQPLDVERIIL